MMALRLMILVISSESLAPADKRLPSAMDMAMPTMNKKKGKTKSVGVQPCHSACLKGA